MASGTSRGAEACSEGGAAAGWAQAQGGGGGPKGSEPGQQRAAHCWRGGRLGSQGWRSATPAAPVCWTAPPLQAASCLQGHAAQAIAQQTVTPKVQPHVSEALREASLASRPVGRLAGGHQGQALRGSHARRNRAHALGPAPRLHGLGRHRSCALEGGEAARGRDTSPNSQERAIIPEGKIEQRQRATGEIATRFRRSQASLNNSTGERRKIHSFPL